MRLLLAVLLALTLAPGVAAAQTCASTVFGDGVCDCGCGTVDPDCPGGAKFTACARSHCTAGTVPWEHQPNTCMASACGDGWNDTAGGETCDDGNALASGGCAATCATVTAGYVCGEGASGCRVGSTADAGQPDAGQPDAGGGEAPDSGVDGAPDAGGGSPGPGPGAEPTTGCGAAGAGLLFPGLLLLARRRRADARA